jgi:hypothetical protein
MANHPHVKINQCQPYSPDDPVQGMLKNEHSYDAYVFRKTRSIYFFNLQMERQ